jgi:hypothetical protein
MSKSLPCGISDQATIREDKIHSYGCLYSPFSAEAIPQGRFQMKSQISMKKIAAIIFCFRFRHWHLFGI